MWGWDLCLNCSLQTDGDTAGIPAVAKGPWGQRERRDQERWCRLLWTKHPPETKRKESPNRRGRMDS